MGAFISIFANQFKAPQGYKNLETCCQCALYNRDSTIYIYCTEVHLYEWEFIYFESVKIKIAKKYSTPINTDGAIHTGSSRGRQNYNSLHQLTHTHTHWQQRKAEPVDTN